MKPTIVISAYNRPPALARLLANLERAAYPGDGGVRLIISIDRGEHPANAPVRQMAEHYQWPFGPKDVIDHPAHLGLVNHFFFCGNLTQTYGPIIYLEDDLAASPVFYAYASQALAYYAEDERIAGLCLYALWFNGYTQQPFFPLADEADVFFLQTPYTQGQAWTPAQWAGFAQWCAAGHPRVTPADPLHEAFLHFDAEDWFPAFARYVVTTNRFYVYPRVSLTTGCGDAGTHFTQTSAFFQAPLQRFKTRFTFKPLADSVAVYDSFFEILPERLNRLTEALHGWNYDVDLYATKAPRHLRADYVLTTRPAGVVTRSFGNAFWPLEANIIENAPGDAIVLCPREAVRWDGWAELLTQKRNHDFFMRRRRYSRARLALYALIGGWQRLRQGR